MIRNELFNDVDNDCFETLHEDVLALRPKKLFLGRCHGIACYKRCENADAHIMIAPLTEDDGCWFLSNGGSSSFWIDDMIEVLNAVNEWLKTQEPDIYKSRQCGYKFKE